MPLKSVFNPLLGEGFQLVPTTTAQVVTVGTSGAMYTTISAALASITDATALKPYVIEIGPGVYTENITAKEYVYLQNGLSGAVTVVGTYALTGTTGSAGIRGITFKWTPTADGQAVADITAGVFYCVDCDFYLIGAADYVATGVKATSNTWCNGS